MAKPFKNLIKKMPPEAKGRAEAKTRKLLNEMADCAKKTRRRRRMENPVKTLLTWLGEQKKEEQIDIAFLMSGAHPSFSFDTMGSDYDKSLNQFYSKIDEYSGVEFENPGFLVSFIAVFEFIFVRRRGTKESWEKQKQLFEKILQSTDPEHPVSIKKTTQELLNKLPGREKIWLEICNQWQELRNTSLSDEAIEKWDDANTYNNRRL